MVGVKSSEQQILATFNSSNPVQGFEKLHEHMESLSDNAILPHLPQVGRPKQVQRAFVLLIQKGGATALMTSL